MKRSSLLLVTLVILSGGFWGTAQAHFLQEDNGISGVLHMPPADEPSAGETTNMYIAFGDKKNKFNLSNCDCIMTISQDGKQLASITMLPQSKGSDSSGVASYDFPAIGVYDAIVTGSATNKSFPDFTIPFVVRVASDVRSSAAARKQSDNTAFLAISGGALIGIGIFGYAGVRDGGRYVPRKK